MLRGTVGDSAIAMSKAFGHYATQTRPAKAGEHAVPNVDFLSLERQIGKRFDTLLVDCEGCIDRFFAGTNRKLLRQLQLILIEEDAPAQVDYSKWHAHLRRHGFERIWRIRDTFDPSAAWSRNISHSAWRRGGLGDLPACPAYARSASLDARWLACLDPAGSEEMVPGCHSDPCPTVGR